jgi:nucleoside-diphosphate-sugar epimerase
MAINFFEKEVEKLSIRFNSVFGEQTVCDLRSRYLSIFAICRAGIIARYIRDETDEKRIGDMTREFCKIRDGMNRFFDMFESQLERRRYAETGDSKRISASG